MDDLKQLWGFSCIAAICFVVIIVIVSHINFKNQLYTVNATIFSVKEIPSNIFTSPEEYSKTNNYYYSSFLLTTSKGEFYITYIGTNACETDIEEFEVNDSVSLILIGNHTKYRKPNVIKLDKVY